MRTLQRLSYVSQSVGPIGDREIGAILGVSRMLNRRRDVTGLLACAEGYFLQVLEGEARHLDKLLVSLARDGRHRDVRIVRRETVSLRAYSDWAMAFVPSLDLRDSIAELHAAAAAPGGLIAALEHDLIGRARDSDAGTLSSFMPSQR